MFQNYLKIAWRNLLHNKSFSIINIAGLAIGMTCCLIIFQYIALESSFDRFHEKKDNLFRVLQAMARGTDELGTGHAYTAQALAPALKDGVPEIVNITRLHSDDALVSDPNKPDKVFEEDAILYADPAFMKMFSFPLVTGNQAKAMTSGNVIITESAARKYFGTTKAEGQSLAVVGSIDKTYTVAGVVKDPPANSHLQFRILLPVEDLLKGEDYASEPEGGWSWNNFTTYIELHPDADLAVVEKKMTDIFLKYRGEMIKQQGGRAAMHVQPLTDIHLNSDIEGAGQIVAGSYRTVYFFLVIGLITLVIALVNYINLATARALNRSREVGVRKVVGARREQLVIQFLYESGLTMTAAIFIALAITAALIPFVNDIAETQLTPQQWLDPKFLLAFGVIVCGGTLLAGLYPAFVLSSFQPGSALKGKTKYVASHLWLRKGLVVVQFAACIVLIAGTAVVYNQLNFMRKMDLGLNLKQVVAVSGPRVLSENADRATVVAGFMNEIRKLPGIEEVAMSSSLPGLGFNWNGASIRKATDDPSQAIRGVATYIDTAFAKLYKLKLVAGREFSDINNVEDTEDAPWMVIINQTAVKTLGFASPEDAVNESLDIGGYKAQVLGVYKDFKWSSAHQEQQTIVFGRSTTGNQISIRLATSNFSDVIKKVQTTYDALFPGNVFHYRFVDETFDLQYRNDQRFAKLFSIFAGMSIFIACLGLFGLVAFTAQQRTKEIGMRKVLGATVSGIVALLSKDFLKLVVLGFLLAVPITWYVMNQWLENFAYRTDISIGILSLAGLIALIIALATVTVQSLKAALANPVNSLRNE
jgi:putative ABC transport system permease protein